ncbi:MAG TPA: hypothetical protein VGX76_22095 [Pirellulales bacterium]|nr:hypothetical protein [Pirellulales bacterium]
MHFRDDDYRLPSDGIAQIADEVRELGPRAEGLIPDLRRIVMAPLLDHDVRCYAAFALASFPRERHAALQCLENFALGHDYSRLAARLLQRIDHMSPAEKTE